MQFSVATSQARIYDPEQQQLDDACASRIIPSGSQAHCSVTFVLDLDEIPTTLQLADSNGDSVTLTTPVLPTPSPSCITVEHWEEALSATCSSCTSYSCNDAFNAYTTQCSACSENCQSAGNLCSCEEGCDTATCQSLYQAFISCELAACEASCS